MKACQITEFGIKALRPIEVDTKRPGPNEVLVKFRAVSLNYRDLMTVEGTYDPRLRRPLVPFSDGAGDVAEVGANVDHWKVGDRVCPIFMQGWIDGELDFSKSRTTLGGNFDGCLREFGSFDQDGLVRIPEHLSYVEAACLPCAGVTAWNALMVSGAVRPRESVLVQGTGGVSLFALQFAKLAGARVFLLSSSNEKLERGREMGADELINYREREDWDNVVLELTAKRGVDHIIEVGGAGTLRRSIRATKVGGHIAVIGVAAGEGEFSHVPIFMKALRLHGIFVGSREMFEEMNRVIEREQLRPVIDRQFAFGEAREALEYMKKGEHFGKIVIEMN